MYQIMTVKRVISWEGRDALPTMLQPFLLQCNLMRKSLLGPNESCDVVITPFGHYNTGFKVSHSSWLSFLHSHWQKFRLQIVNPDEVLGKMTQELEKHCSQSIGQQTRHFLHNKRTNATNHTNTQPAAFSQTKLVSLLT